MASKQSINLKINPFTKKKAEKEDKKKLDHEQAAKAYEDFVESFSDKGTSAKTFVRGSTINPESKEEDASKAGLMYKLSHKLLESKKEDEAEAKTPKKKKEKGKTVLEMFREELRKHQEERQERRKMKTQGLLPHDAPEVLSEDKFKVQEFDAVTLGSHDTGNPLTTNLYIGNIHPKMNEEMLCHTFGRYGSLASVKVMWPRTEEERSRNKNCGFVAFMNRMDAEACLEDMRDSEIMGFPIQIGWGKAVPLPPNPIYVPPNKEDAMQPDPPSGLPFNAQLKKGMKESQIDKNNVEKVLYSTTVKVTIPQDRDILRMIHRMIEFVIREGHMFEALIMHREMGNSKFSFLFDNKSPEHVYYRWKLFSILNGDSPETWKTADFHMFQSGSLWTPPPLKNLRAHLMPPVEDIVKKGQLVTKHREELEERLHNITMERSSVSENMQWCIEHSESALEIVECITESLCIPETPLPYKVARLYLMNDILQNTGSKQHKIMLFRKSFESRLMTIVEHLHTVHRSIEKKSLTLSFKKRVMAVLKALQEQSIFHWDFITKVITAFLGHTIEEQEKRKAFETVAALMKIKQADSPEEHPSDVDGAPMDTEQDDLDGIPMDFNKPIDFSGLVPQVEGGMDEDLDGVPLDDLDGEPLDPLPLAKEESPGPAVSVAPVVKSKWDDTADDGTTSNSQKNVASSGSDQSIDEERRKKLRDVEMKVLELVDALESHAYSKEEIEKKADKYRQKLLREIEVAATESPQGTKKGGSPSSEEGEEPGKKKDKGRSRSPPSPNRKSSRSRHRSKSPSRSRHSSRSKRRRSRSRSPRQHRRSRSRSPRKHNKH